jgi:hypothetical protein
MYGAKAFPICIQDKDLPMSEIHRDYQQMYYRWRFDAAFYETTLRNAYDSVKAYWTS